MELLKETNALTEGKYYGTPTTVKEMLVAMNTYLKGFTVFAFGKKSKGLWGKNDVEQTFDIHKIVGHYFEDGFSGTIDVYLKGYTARKDGLIYTDKNFLSSFKDQLKEEGLMKFIKSVDYSEQGMQGANYVNLDIEFKVPKK